MTAKYPSVVVYRSTGASAGLIDGDTHAATETEWRYRFKATNGTIVDVSSESYTRRRWALRGVEVVLGAKRGSLEFVKPGESKLVHRRHDKVLVKVECGKCSGIGRHLPYTRCAA